MTGVFRRLADELAKDRQDFARWLGVLRSADLDAESNDERCSYVALKLQNTYSSIENMFKRIASVFGDDLGGAQWHSDLLDAMATARPGLRPAVISAEVATELRALLKFRHFVVHGSVSQPLNAEPLAAVKRDAEGIAPRLTAELDAFGAHIEALAVAEESGEPG